MPDWRAGPLRVQSPPWWWLSGHAHQRFVPGVTRTACYPGSDHLPLIVPELSHWASAAEAPRPTCPCGSNIATSLRTWILPSSPVRSSRLAGCARPAPCPACSSRTPPSAWPTPPPQPLQSLPPCSSKPSAACTRYPLTAPS